MDIVRLKNPTRILGAPQNWDHEKSGPCGALPIIDQPDASGLNFMVSFWRPTAEEIEALQRGATIQLHIEGFIHPVVAMAVSDPRIPLDEERTH